MRRIAVLLWLFGAGDSALAQVSSLNLDSGSVIKGGSVSLNLSLTVGSGPGPAALEWTLSYPSGDVTCLGVTAGAALTSAGKTLNCAWDIGSVTCVASGPDSDTLNSGVVAEVTATIAPGTGSSSDSISIANVMGAYPDASLDSIAATGGTISLVNPAPAISGLSPPGVTEGTGAFSLTVDGTGFVSGSVVNWNGSGRATTYVSATQLTAAILQADSASAGTAQVMVSNPPPGGGASLGATFTINASNPGNCSFTLGSTSASLTQTGTATNGVTIIGVLPEVPLTVSVTPTSGSNCTGNYTVSSSASWLSAVGGTSSFAYTALTNPQPSARSATLLIANPNGGAATFTVTEAGDSEPLLNRQVRALYQSVLGRDPDSAGFAFWTGSRSAGIGQMLDSFLTGAEAFNTDFAVMATYQAATGTPPTYAQFTAAVSGVRAGAAIGGLFNTLIASGYTVQNLYQNLLNRAPLSDEVATASAVGLAGTFQTLIGYPAVTPPVAVLNNEFMSTGTFDTGVDHTNGLYIAMLYNVVLGRELDPSGYSFWLGVANTGGPGILFQGASGYPTRIQILGSGVPNQGFAGSPEFQDLYQAPSAADLPAVAWDISRSRGMISKFLGPAARPSADSAAFGTGSPTMCAPPEELNSWRPFKCSPRGVPVHASRERVR